MNNIDHHEISDAEFESLEQQVLRMRVEKKYFKPSSIDYDVIHGLEFQDTQSQYFEGILARQKEDSEKLMKFILSCSKPKNIVRLISDRDNEDNVDVNEKGTRFCIRLLCGTTYYLHITPSYKNNYNEFLLLFEPNVINGKAVDNKYSILFLDNDGNIKTKPAYLSLGKKVTLVTKNNVVQFNTTNDSYFCYQNGGSFILDDYGENTVVSYLYNSLIFTCNTIKSRYPLIKSGCFYNLEDVGFLKEKQTIEQSYPYYVLSLCCFVINAQQEKKIQESLQTNDIKITRNKYTIEIETEYLSRNYIKELRETNNLYDSEELNQVKIASNKIKVFLEDFNNEPVKSMEINRSKVFLEDPVKLNKKILEISQSKVFLEDSNKEPVKLMQSQKTQKADGTKHSIVNLNQKDLQDTYKIAKKNLQYTAQEFERIEKRNQHR